MLLVGNGRVVTRDPEKPFVEDGAVVIDRDKIVAVGTRAEMDAAYPTAAFIDAHGGLIMPGLIN